MTAAETGHLVIATCHTPNAMQTIDRVVSVFPSQQQGLVIAQLSTSLRGVIAQRLVPTADKKDRVLAYEVLTMNAAARTNIREHHVERLPNVIQTSRKDGMVSMDDSLVRLYLDGRISYDTCMSHAADPQAVKIRIHRKS